MVFSSVIFIFIFLPITLIGYYLLRGEARNYWLLFVSLVFFGWSQPNYLWIILLNIAVNYAGAMIVNKAKIFRKLVLFIAIAANLLILFYFKYFDFFIDSINKLVGTSFDLKNIVLPIGISFFTFQGMSYVIDVYRKEVDVQKNPLKLALYITLFPQLIAGPIVRYKDIANEIESRESNLNDFAEGIQRFILGLGKKSLIANTMALLVDSVWNAGCDCHLWSVAWIASIAYTLQIYFDFSGYSDMAIGLGKMFGFHFEENFRLPYISQSITEFWRRWHISLSSWFRDYVYIPLGGNRKNVYINLAIVFLLTGIWHGASWHFVAWGIWNGVFILAERILQKKNSRQENQNEIASTLLKKIYTLLIVNFGWVLFRAPNIGDALLFVKSMFGMAEQNKIGYTLFWYLDKWTAFIMLIGILFSSKASEKLVIYAKHKINSQVYSIAKYTLLLVLFYFSIMRIVSGTYNPFIYFQF